MAGSPTRGSSASRFKATDKGKMKAKEEWFETELHPDLKLSLALKRVIRHRNSNFQEIMVIDTEGFGRVLVINGKPQSAEADGFVYYESLVHPALLMHDNPKKVFIMGGGEGSAAREVLRHKTIEKVILCERDKEVVDLCRLCFEENWAAFSDPRLEIITSDASEFFDYRKGKYDVIIREFFKYRKDKYDVIIGDLPFPIEGEPFYTKSFYETVIKPRLNDGGIFVTQAGLAGVKSRKVFASVYNTLKLVFQSVLPVTATVPLHADTCGWVMASDSLLAMINSVIEERINARIKGELRYHDSASILTATIMNKLIWKELENYNRNHIVDEDMMMIDVDTWCKNASGNA